MDSPQRPVADLPLDPSLQQDTGPAGRHAADLAAYVSASPTGCHAAAEGARRLEAAGFRGLDESAAWSSAEVVGRRYVLRDGALIAWIAPEPVRDHVVRPLPLRVIGAHTDSPSFRLKPQPSTAAHGWRQLGVEVYGGPLLNSWLDRELRVAGRLVVRTERGLEDRLVATGPLARIPQLAIHLDRTANQGLTLDPQKHVQPVWAVDAPETPELMALLAEQADGGPVDPAAILGCDLLLADAQAPRRFGARQELLASSRLDNLTSVHAGLVALTRDAVRLEQVEQLSMLAAFDHEEVGSRTRSGAGGPFLEDVIARIGSALGWTQDARRASLASSSFLSADAGHLVHPSYPGHHDPAHRPVPGGGPLLKTNADQHYTTDAHGRAEWLEACAAAGVPTQDFVSHNAVPCGSTIGPISAARLGMRTLDVGVGLLSMHSARELVHVQDLHSLGLAVRAWLDPSAR